MSNGLLSIKKCDVSYLEVYQNWIRNDRDRNNGESTIPINEIARKLMLSTLLKKPEYQIVNRQESDEDKLVKLFNDYMPAKGDEGLNQVVDSLNGNNNFDLANDLIAQMEKCLFFRDTSMPEQNQTVDDDHAARRPVSNPKPTPSPRRAPMKVQNPLMVEAQEHLSKFIILNIDFMAEFWSDKLHVSNTRSAYVDVLIIEDFKDDRGKVVPSGDYVPVFENLSKPNCTRILIQGDPGCGKSTYVNKVAIDWANKNEYLRNKFHLVFLISLQTLKVGIEQAIRNLLPQPSIKFVEDYYKHHNSKVLLILDGFDELQEYSPFYKEVMKMLEGDQTMSQYSFFTTIVTSRRSHVDKVPKRFHARSLLIKGFDKQSMKLFLQTQKIPVPNEQTDPNLVVLLQNPFFCAIYCSLHRFGVDKSKLEDPYDFVKVLKALNLGGCNLSTHEATEVVKLFKENCLPKLIKFELSRNSNVGSTLALLAALGNCKQLERLDLSRCYLSIESINRLTTCVVDNCWLKLSQLDLSWNSNVGSTPALFAALGNCEQLEKLDLQECALSIESINRLTTCIDNNCWVKLNQLGLPFNAKVGSTPALFVALGKCKQLERFDLKSCVLSDESINQLITCIDNCWVKLSKLNLSGNRNVGSMPALFAALGKCKQLERLDLRSCGLSIESINRFTTCIDNCWVKLSELDLSWNSNVGSIPALFAALGNWKQLERLDLHKCDLSIESINRLTTCIDDNCWVKLSQLDLSWNRNVGSTPALFSALGKCKQLERLNVGWCDLSTESINRLTICIDDNCWPNLIKIDK